MPIDYPKADDMKRSDIEKNIEKLKDLIKRHDNLYYVQNKPEISDEEYDKIYRKLKDVEGAHPELITPDSPTQRVGGKPTEDFPVVKHIVPMLSMDNTYSAEELRQFDERVRKNLKDEKYEYIVELKFDGVSTSLLYENGILKRGATRGDGVEGDDVTGNLKTIRSIPLSFRDSVKKCPRSIEVRGEVYMTKKIFEEINREKEKTGEELFANPRNATAGSLKLLDPKLVARRHLNIYIWGIGHCEGIDFKAHTDALDYLEEAGFRVNPHRKVCANIEEVIEYCNSWEPKRYKLDFNIDGMVIKINDRRQRERLGVTTKSPRWEIAYKFPAEKAMTTVEDIIIQVGRTGTITPVAILKPVHLSGTTVSRATLHNFDEINRLDVRIGDKVNVEKSGEIIPKVLSVAKEKRTGREKSFAVPTVCPACGSRLHQTPDEVAIRCENAGCSAQIKERMLHFASRDAMDIDGMGEAIVNQLVDKGLVKDYGDIYSLKKEHIKDMERMAEKSAANLINAIEKSKGSGLHRLIYALGIRHVGEHAAWVLADNFGSIENLAGASVEALTRINEIGPVMAESINNFFSSGENRKIIKKLADAGLRMVSERPKERGGKLTGKTIVVTGTLKDFSRGEAEETIRRLGGNPSSSVSKNTDFLVVGTEPGSKVDKAKALGVKIIDEEGFKKLTR